MYGNYTIQKTFFKSISYIELKGKRPDDIGGGNMFLRPETKDIELIRQINAGNRDAANELINKYYKCVYKDIYLKLLDEEQSMDITQEVFISVLKGLRKFDESKASFKTWILRITANKVTDYFRSRQYHEKKLIETMDDNISEEKNSEIDIEKEILDKMTLDELEILYGHHENIEWEVFKQKVYEGYTFVEIGKKLDLDISSVKRKYYAMVKRIREEWDYYE